VAVAGRAIVAGIKVAPADTHDVLVSHPGVESCVIVAREHHDFGSVLSAVVHTANQQLTTADLCFWCAQRLTPPQRPHAIELRVHAAAPAPETL
jgi:acyl-coenzyme A synthetase/AMP-(fatty) acid ligase